MSSSGFISIALSKHKIASLYWSRRCKARPKIGIDDYPCYDRRNPPYHRFGWLNHILARLRCTFVDYVEPLLIKVSDYYLYY